MHEMQSLLAQYGLLLVFGNVLLAQLGLPLPAVPMLIIAGAFAASGQLAPAAILGVTLAASPSSPIAASIKPRLFSSAGVRRRCWWRNTFPALPRWHRRWPGPWA